MTNIINFAICRYVPSILRGEKINIGLVYHVPSMGVMDFVSSKNIRRIKSFDDEIEADVIKAIFESLNYEFSSFRLDGSLAESGLDITQKGLLNELIKGYVNQVQFEKVRMLEFNESLDAVVSDMIDMYLYYDKKKSERIDQNRVRALAARIVNSSPYKDSYTKVEKKKNFFDPPYDFKINIENDEKYIKAFSFDYLNPSKIFKEMKSYLYDLQHAKEQFGIDISDVKIVVNNTTFELEHEIQLKNNLPVELQLLTLERFSSFISKNESSQLQ